MCVNAKNKAWRQVNRERVNALEKERRSRLPVEVRREKHRKYYAENKTKVDAKNKKWAAENRERSRSNQARWHAENKGRRQQQSRDRRFGLALGEYDQMIVDQMGMCAICSREGNVGGIALAVDHCHNTGKVRGLLCNPCNTSIGLLGDDATLVLKAAAYLVERGS